MLAEDLKYIFDKVNEELKTAEIKNGFLVALSGAACFGVLNLMFKLNGDRYLFWPLLLITVSLFIGLLIGLLSFLPHIELSDNLLIGQSRRSTEGTNLLSCGDIRKLSASEYKKAYCGGGEAISPLDEDLIERILVNAKLTIYKSSLFLWALRIVLVGFSLAIIVCIGNAGSLQ